MRHLDTQQCQQRGIVLLVSLQSTKKRVPLVGDRLRVPPACEAVINEHKNGRLYEV